MTQNPKCSPLENNINIKPGPPLPGQQGFGFDLNLGLPQPALSDGIPEDIISWIRKLRFKLPGLGALQSYVDSLTQTVTKILSDLLSYLNVFLGFFLFALAIIELIMCIINVLCSLPNMWATIKAVKKLIRKCLPLFISICFPYFALLNLLLSLLAILLALIEYIILMIRRLIEQIIKNLKKLYTALTKGNTAAGLAIVNKIANLLCLFEQIFMFLEIIFAIFELITTAWSKTIKGCARKGSAGADDSTVCSEFLSDPTSQDVVDPEIHVTRTASSNGKLWYCKQAYGSYSFLPTSSGEIRKELVYLFDNSLVTDLKFNNIIKSNGFTFFPFDKVITPALDLTKKPYLVDLSVMANPGDGNGTRLIQIKDITVTTVTTTAQKEVISFSGGSQVVNQTDVDGILVLSGGSSVDTLGYNGRTIEQILRGSEAQPTPDVGTSAYLEFTGISHALKANYNALAEYQLITMNCFPSIGEEQAMLEATFPKGLTTVIPDYVTPPDIGKAIERLQGAFNTYRGGIDEDTTNKFGADLENIMNDLQTEASNSYCQSISAMMNETSMTISLNPDLQFINNDIQVGVIPTDVSGRTFSDMIGSFTPPAACLNSLADKFKAEATFGKSSNFVYDGYGQFVSNISSDKAGSGEVKVYFDGNQIVTIIKTDTMDIQPVIDSSGKPYTFIGFDSNNAGAPRRDEGDTSRR
jgi:hypothetical protein